MARKYNFLYNKIVRDERDVVGHIAYALYKSSKIRHIEKYKEENNNREPTEEVLERFHSISCQDDQIERYKLQATAILQDFLDNTLAETTQKIEAENKAKQLEILKQVNSIKPKGFMHGVWQGLAASGLFMVFFSAIMFVVLMSSHEYTFTIGNSGVKKVQIQEQQASMPEPLLTENEQK